MSYPTVSEAIKTDHRELESYYNEITRWRNQFTWELARHSIGEELVVYPAMEKYLTDGKAMAAKDRAEHGQIKIQLKAFQKMLPTDPDFQPTIDNLYHILAQHIKEEETSDLPRLEEGLREADAHNNSESLAKSFERTKMFVPTRSHPSAPDKPPFETVVGLLAAPIDKLADLFRKFPKEVPSSGVGNSK
ncbi:hypothetical protein L873DRAFT_1828812 [Choiromyces venosus 120613-1]|uniref:Hemerythrin-like domain-containing protein n=1 Tax=Choiromyces venosus 120613-1 TaxID=1336337 RepID=A0A3N4JI93_9PEZI|nr:hypothetical protein L873DRAFT_1828812 [Choiromyces venosus 120613-1]